MTSKQNKIKQMSTSKVEQEQDEGEEWVCAMSYDHLEPSHLVWWDYVTKIYSRDPSNEIWTTLPVDQGMPLKV